MAWSQPAELDINMKQLKLRFAQMEDAAQIVEWINANPKNEFDPGILKYPTLRVLCSYEDPGRPVCYLPFHRVFMLESVAQDPLATKLTVAQAVRDFTKAVELVSSAEGIHEIYFLGGADGMGELAASNGYEELPYKVYRMRL